MAGLRAVQQAMAFRGRPILRSRGLPEHLRQGMPSWTFVWSLCSQDPEAGTASLLIVQHAIELRPERTGGR
eukprot:2635120-Alexandrium_andersonii.AAC.1